MNKTVVLLIVSILLLNASCANPTRPVGYGHDSFGPKSLAFYDRFSDSGSPWQVSGDTLKADGVGVQSVLIRKDEGFGEGWVEIETDRADDGGLIVNFLDNEHYYLLAIRDDSAPQPKPQENLVLYERSGRGAAGFKILWTKDLVMPRGKNHRICFFVTAREFTIFADGTIFEIPYVTTFTGYRFGIRHNGIDDNWHDHFRNFYWSAATLPQV